MILALLIWLTFLNFVKKFLPLGLQCLLRNSWNYSRIKWLSERLWDAYLVRMYFLMWITVHLLTPNLHFISQSHFCCVVSFSFIFSSDNISKYGKGQPWYKHDCCCRMAAPGHYRNTLMLLCQARNQEPKAHLPPQPLLCLQERPNCPGARKDELLLCLCVPPGCQHQWKPNIHFQKIFFPLKLSGHSPSFAYKLSKNLLIWPARHCMFTMQECRARYQHIPAQSSACTRVHLVAFSQFILEHDSTAGPEVIPANSTNMWKKTTEKALILVT